MSAGTTTLALDTPRPATRPGPSTRMYKRVGGISLIAAPALLLGSELAYRGTSKPAALVADAVDDRAGIIVAMVLLLASSVFVVPAAATVLHLARDRGRYLARAGVVFGTLGALGHAAYAGFTVIQLATAGGDRTAMTQLLERANSSAVVAPVAVCIESFAVGVVFLAFAAWRAGVVGRYAPAAIAGAFLLEAANAGSAAAGAVKEALALIALGSVGVVVIRMSDRAWGVASDRLQGPRSLPLSGGEAS